SYLKVSNNQKKNLQYKYLHLWIKKFKWSKKCKQAKNQRDKEILKKYFQYWKYYHQLCKNCTLYKQSQTLLLKKHHFLIWKKRLHEKYQYLKNEEKAIKFYLQNVKKNYFRYWKN